MTKNYYYYLVPGDIRSEKVEISTEEVREVEHVLSGVVADNYRADINTMRANRDAGKLLSVSFHILGGNDPLLPFSVKGKRTKVFIRQPYHELYTAFFFDELVKMLPKFDRAKGCWHNYVKFARLNAMRSLDKYRVREEKENVIQNRLYELGKELDSELVTLCETDKEYAIGERVFEEMLNLKQELSNQK